MKMLKKPAPFLGALAALTVMALLLILYTVSKPVPMAGTKDIFLEVAYQNGAREYYEISTEAHYLKEALDSVPDLTLEGSYTEEFGLMVITINGVRADYQKDGAYWALLLNGTPCNYGVSKQPIKDGERYSFEYTPASSMGKGS